MINSTLKSVVVLLGISAAVYAFSPQAGLIQPESSVVTAEGKTYPVTIKDRALADPRQADLRTKVGGKSILVITTDEDGSLSLRSSDRVIFNPIFSGTVNTLSIPTDRASSYQLVFKPGAGPDQAKLEILIGTVVVER